MRRVLFVILLTSMAVAQVPQSPRQALLEMFKATSPDQIDRHTPEVLLQALSKLPPDVRQRQRQSMMFLSMAMTMAGNSIQTFESGPILVLIRNPKDNSRVEITVERDDLSGDTDAMEFGVRVTKEGKQQEMPAEFRILVNMKMEKNVWKLERVGASASLALDDPKMAEAIVDKILEQEKNRAANTSIGIQVTGQPRTISEQNVVTSLRTLNTAESSYLSSYPSVGYACRLSDLGGSLGGRSPDEHGAQLINPALEAGTRYGYRFEISGCTATGYKIVAAPTQKGVGHLTYCTDQSGVVKSVAEAGAIDCAARGVAVK